MCCMIYTNKVNDSYVFRRKIWNLCIIYKGGGTQISSELYLYSFIGQTQLCVGTLFSNSLLMR